MPNYDPILDSEIDAESPITESLMTRLRDNPIALFQGSYTVLTGSGNYTVPSNVTKLRCILVSGGGGGGSSPSSGFPAGGGASGRVVIRDVSTTGGASISYACGAGGAGGSAGSNDGSQGGNTTFGSITAIGGSEGARADVSQGGGGGNMGIILDVITTVFKPASDDGTTYYGGRGGIGYSSSRFNNAAGNYPVFGVHGTGAANQGGGGAAMCMPFWINGLESYLGDGGNGGNLSAGGNATNYGGGGGGADPSGTAYAGGNGSGGIIFVLPIE